MFMKSWIKVLMGIIVILVLGLIIYYFSSDDKTPVVFDWKGDGIILMEDVATGDRSCFGCNVGSDGTALCIDPSFQMSAIDETASLYCDDEFNVVGS